MFCEFVGCDVDGTEKRGWVDDDKFGIGSDFAGAQLIFLLINLTYYDFKIL